MNPTLGTALFLCLALAAQSRGQSPEAAKARSGILFGEGASAAGEAALPAVRDRVLESGSPLPRPGMPGLRISEVPGPAGGTVDDVSRTNPTPVDSVRLPATEGEIREALAYARARHLRVSMAGARHSQGGQIVYDNNVVLDMARFNRFSVDKENKILTVQSGARWIDIQRSLDAQGLSLDVIQTHNIFSVGGSLSVNAQG
ncbi:MAG: FAD-dependent oxidoreductase, partial [Elusimicrobiota bacterium]